MDSVKEKVKALRLLGSAIDSAIGDLREVKADVKHLREVAGDVGEDVEEGDAWFEEVADTSMEIERILSDLQEALDDLKQS